MPFIRNTVWAKRSGEQLGGVLGEVGDGEVGAGAADAHQRFEDGAVAVEPAFFDGGLEHGVLAGDLVGTDGDADAAAGCGDDVEIGHGGLHENHVGAFVEVEVDFAHGFAEVGAVHLVGFAVAELGGGVGGFAEGTVKGRCDFGGVAEDGRVGEVFFVEGAADGSDAAVHHVAGGDDVGARLGQADGGAG